MQPRFFAGIDGGATATRARVVDADGHRVGEAEAGPSSLTLGVAAAWDAVRTALAGAGIAGAMLAETALACGLAGTGAPANRASFLAMAPSFARLVLCSDGHATTLGAHGGTPGATVAVGTGTVGNVVRADGTTAQVAGWGFPVADEGSGAWIGRRALAETLRLVDGRPVDPPGGSALHQEIRALCGPTPSAFLEWLYPAPSTKYATLARAVVRHAEAGDAAASRILDEAAREIEDVVRALDPDGTLPLSLGGGLAPVIAGRMAPAIRERLVAPRGDAVDGALLLARGSAPQERFPE
jgi:glucosamine kinase